MSGVGQVSGELSVRLRMALCAGTNNIVPMQGRIRIVNWQDQVGGMAIRTFGGSFFPQQGDFTVVGLEVSLGQGFVATSAATEDIVPEIRSVDADDLVAGVTVFAVW